MDTCPCADQLEAQSAAAALALLIEELRAFDHPAIGLGDGVGRRVTTTASSGLSATMQKEGNNNAVMRPTHGQVWVRETVCSTGDHHDRLPFIVSSIAVAF